MICLLCNSALYCATSYIISFILRKLSSYFSLNTDSSHTQGYFSLKHREQPYTKLSITPPLLFLYRYKYKPLWNTNTRSATCYPIVKN